MIKISERDLKRLKQQMPLPSSGGEPVKHLDDTVSEKREIDFY